MTTLQAAIYQLSSKVNPFADNDLRRWYENGANGPFVPSIKKQKYFLSKLNSGPDHEGDMKKYLIQYWTKTNNANAPTRTSVSSLRHGMASNENIARQMANWNKIASSNNKPWA